MAIEAKPDLLTIREAAEILRLSEVTISRWLKQGRLPGYRVGPRAVRIRRADLEAMLTPTRERAGMRWHMVDSIEELVFEPLSNEEVAQQLEALRQAELAQEQMLARRGGRPAPSSAPLIREEREKRSRQIDGWTKE